MEYKGFATQKILIGDDNASFRQALRASIHSQFQSLIISEAKDGEEALQTIPTFELLPHAGRRIQSFFYKIRAAMYLLLKSF